ncbi:hypothetical protein LOD99_8802 [Oopsacas minuta]|uniref:Uncharacterized protein n=1 Tax=Oopsacas minuta TaxID=111878 RepID=A0AAV7JFG6_9METZ|nr:hypothetical protein LOD99_8802 [Oopsacas minuta]
MLSRLHARARIGVPGKMYCLIIGISVAEDLLFLLIPLKNFSDNNLRLQCVFESEHARFELSSTLDVHGYVLKKSNSKRQVLGDIKNCKGEEAAYYCRDSDKTMCY